MSNTDSIAALAASLTKSILAGWNNAQLTPLEQQTVCAAAQEIAQVSLLSIGADTVSLGTLKWRHDAAVQALTNIQTGIHDSTIVSVEHSIQANLPALLLNGAVIVAGLAGGPAGSAIAQIISSSVLPQLQSRG